MGDGGTGGQRGYLPTKGAWFAGKKDVARYLRVDNLGLLLVWSNRSTIGSSSGGGGGVYNASFGDVPGYSLVHNHAFISTKLPYMRFTFPPFCNKLMTYTYVTRDDGINAVINKREFEINRSN